MKSAKLWMITDSSLCRPTSAQETAASTLLSYCQKHWASLDTIIIREPYWTKPKLVSWLEMLPQKLGSHPKLVLNWPMTYEPWDLPIDGIHLNGKAADHFMSDPVQCQILLQHVQSNDWQLGLSIHSGEEWAAWRALAPSYVLISNVFETACKPGKQGLGLDGTKALACQIRQDAPGTNCIGLGGLKASDAEDLLKMGLDGLALRSELHRD